MWDYDTNDKSCESEVCHFFCKLLFGGRGLSCVCCIFAAEIIKNTFYDDFRQL